MNESNVVQELEKRFLPSLQRMAEEISRDFPNVKTTVWSYSVGSQTDYDGHDIGIECLFPDAGPDQTDNVALSIDVRHVTTLPEVDSADVCWGHPSAYIEAELLEAPVEATEEILEQLEEGLPELYKALRVAVARRQPADEV